jgi:hypothetical protein
MLLDVVYERLRVDGLFDAPIAAGGRNPAVYRKLCEIAQAARVHGILRKNRDTALCELRPRSGMR